MFKEVEGPLLAVLASRGGASRPQDEDGQGRNIYDALADHFDLNHEARASELWEDGKLRNEWENRVRWAVRKLRKEGLLQKTPDSGRGNWMLTEEGVKTAGRFETDEGPSSPTRGGKPMTPQELQELLALQARIGARGEILIVSIERRRLTEQGRPDLARRVRHVALEDVTLGYDVESFNTDGSARLIEVKTSTGDNPLGFEMSLGEVAAARRLGPAFWLYRVTGLRDSEPSVTMTQDPIQSWLESGISLRPTKFRVEQLEKGKGAPKGSP
jgi:hypothetical protein